MNRRLFLFKKVQEVYLVRDAGCLAKRFRAVIHVFFEACLWLVEEFYISSWDDETLQLRFRIHEVSEIQRDGNDMFPDQVFLD